MVVVNHSWNESCTNLDSWIPNNNHFPLDPEKVLGGSLYDFSLELGEDGSILDVDFTSDDNVDSALRLALENKDITEVEVIKKYVDKQKDKEIEYAKAEIADKKRKWFERQKKEKTDDSKNEEKKDD